MESTQLQILLIPVLDANYIKIHISVYEYRHHLSTMA